MEREKLVAYLKTVSDLEAAIYSHEEAKKKLKTRKSELGISATIQKDAPRKAVYKEETYKYQPNTGEGFISLAVVLAYYVVPVLALGCLGYICLDIGSCDFVFKIGLIGFLIVLAVAILALVLWVTNKLSIKKGKERVTPINEKRKRDAEAAVRAEVEQNYQAALNADKARVGKELALASTIESQITGLDKDISAMKRNLEQLYSLNIIYPTYRNYVAVTQIYDYIASGMCPGLEGGDGAYAQYMNDVRAEKIRTSIDELRNVIIQGFSAVITMQNTICNQLSECNSILGSIDSSVSSIGKNIELVKKYSYTSTQYIKEYGPKLDRIADGVDRTALIAGIAEINAIHERAQRGVNTFFMTYPQ